MVKRETDRCPDNLLARSRRGALSAVERRALDAHLGVCDLCRAAVTLGAIYDEGPDAPQPGDDAVVARLAKRVAGPLGRPVLPRTVAVAAAVLLLVLAGGAAAWVVSRARPQSRPVAVAAAHSRSLDPTVASALPPPDPAPTATRDDVQPLPLRRTTTTPDRAQLRPRGGARVHSESSILAAGPPDHGAAALFAAANAARRSGDLRRAIAGYRLLERSYPTSAEAEVSHVSAGDLFVRLGEPAAALDEFNAYRASGDADRLAPEALFGRARCLQTLGRADQERASWHELLRRFPGTIYASAARVRLDELER